MFRTRLDKLGDAREPLCLPEEYRPKCLRLAHEHFGHLGRNKMSDYIRQFFFWPTITVDSIVTVSSERVAIDLVGPFSTARGGFKYLLTCIDMATRWPEAILLRKTTTRIIIEQLTIIFSRCGFPTTVVYDNITQFVARTFQK